ncbi:MAG: hypothetical protein ACHQQS_12305 [Thermoanaerobaculales bacterium]
MSPRRGLLAGLWKVALVSVAIAAPAGAAEHGPGASQVARDPWADMRFLVGDWAGEGGGQPGSGSGEYSFRFELGGKILVRRSFAEYPATEDRAAFQHDDLMIVYAEPGQSGLAAIFFDGEGHVIHYQVTSAGKGRSVVFLSEPAPGVPRYRLTYDDLAGDRVDLKFEIAPPSDPSAFHLYVTARCHRVGKT